MKLKEAASDNNFKGYEDFMKDHKKGEAKIVIVHFDTPKRVTGQSTKILWKTGAPVAKNLSRGGKKAVQIPADDIKFLKTKKWSYFYRGETWYAIPSEHIRE